MSAREWDDPELVDTIAEAMAKTDDIIYGLLTPDEAAFYLGHAHAALEAIVASGRAIVDLPEPYEEYGMQHWPVKQHWRGKPIRSGSVFIRRSDGHMAATSVSNPHDCPGDALSLAAALLAAAAAAEESQ